MNSLSLWRHIATVENHTFLTHQLTPGAVVIDAGANVGGFARAMIGRFGCTVHSFEPHPEHFARIPNDPRIVKNQAAVAAVEGVFRLRLSDNPEASRLDATASDGIEVPTINLEKYAQAKKLSSIALLKLDIEGAELDVLAGLSDAFLARVAQVTIEFHDFAGYMTVDDVKASIARLESRGFAAAKFSRRSYGDTLLVNRRLIPLSAGNLWTLRHLVRNVRGAARMLTRRTGR